MLWQWGSDVEMHLHAFPVGIPSSIEVPRLAVRTVLEHTGQEAEGSMQGDCQMSYSAGKSTGKQYIITPALSEFTERKRIKTRQAQRRNPEQKGLFGRPNW